MDRKPRAARLLACAAAVCGGSFACLLLLSGTAQADDSEVGEGAVAPAGSAGELVGEVSRSGGGAAGRVVDDVVSRTPVVREVVQDAGDLVGSTTDTVATVVEQATRGSDAPVAPAPTSDPGTPAPPALHSAGQPSDAVDTAPGGAGARRDAGRGHHRDVLRAAAPLTGAVVHAVAAPGDAQAVLRRAVDAGSGPTTTSGASLRDLLDACAPCGDARATGSGADSVSLHALPAEGRQATSATAGRATSRSPGAPTAPSRAPDVSPG